MAGKDLFIDFKKTVELFIYKNLYLFAILKLSLNLFVPTILTLQEISIIDNPNINFLVLIIIYH